jgi:predicted TIM-barrel fold metal-dependent hydrolase
VSWEPSTNAAFDEARRGGVIDTAVGFPKSKEEMYEFYSFIRKQTMDSESRQGEGGLKFPAGYMFKDVPEWEQGDLDDPVTWMLAEMDRHGLSHCVIGAHSDDEKRAIREHPDRFSASIGVDPNEGMDALRKLEAAREEHGDALKLVHAFPAGLYPQVALNDKKFYPVYMKCIELDLPFCSTVGVPGPRIRMEPQLVEHLDEICWFFPELKFVTRHGCEPWTALVVKLMLKWPNLYYSTTAFAPKHYPADIVRYANTRGADKIIFSGYFPAGLTYDRQFAELPNVEFRDHVWPKFLRENAQRVFNLP